MVNFSRAAEVMRARGIDAPTRAAILQELRAGVAQAEIDANGNDATSSATEREFTMMASRSREQGAMLKLCLAQAKRLGVSIPRDGIDADDLDLQIAKSPVAKADIAGRLELKGLLARLNLIN
jgi:hypothetical protein